VTAGAFLAHVRASTGSAVQQTNCHPFRHRKWLWMHNGEIHGFRDLRRELMLAIDPTLFAEVAGTTDSEAFFFLALSALSTTRRARWRGPRASSSASAALTA
jgi:predicted glutamine amidotransferase